jgi:pyruvate ferredoxin oxidoreductase gamma subunit
VLLVRGDEAPEAWRGRLALAGPVLALPASGEERQAGIALAGALARLLGVLGHDHLEQALRKELGALGPRALEAGSTAAFAAWEAMAPHAGCIAESAPPRADALPAPDWIELALEPVAVAAPDIPAAATSLAARTGLWRTQRPVIDRALCHRCVWVCTTFCPDGAIDVGPDGFPQIDYEHCKGCLVCAAVCAPHAIHVVPERGAGEPAATPGSAGGTP